MESRRRGGSKRLPKAGGASIKTGMDVSNWPGLILRPITDDDLPLLREIYAGTREDELQQTGWPPEQKSAFLRQQFDAQHAWYQMHYQEANFDLLLAHGAPVGRLYVHRQPHDLNVIDIALLPAHRGRGLGTFLLRSLLAEADREGRTVSLHVEFFNRARSLYDRLGFQQIGSDGVYLEMRREPSAETAVTTPGEERPS